ncbi:reverse transcriptase family protein [Sphingobacterium sp.]|uniref:reverse transcriptase family protein n=1 Tax=Sphingobacterium sp. TaxID=341027 RepID=UPI00289CCA2A|nr:reverse transcriptase family protein [Sphingobacterium sp.]
MLSPEEYLKKKINNISDFRDLLEILNIAKRRIYGKNSRPIELKSLLYYGNTLERRNCFTPLTIKKRNGSVRIVLSPKRGYKVILRCLAYLLNTTSHFPNSAHGFISGRNIVSNATKHVNKNYVLNVDIKDFFDSIDRNQVKLAFMFGSFQLNGKREPIAYFLSNLCTVRKEIASEIRQVLPQGSPTSPILSNIICEKLDRRLKGLANRFNLHYTRYADDLTFSSMYNFYEVKDFRRELSRVIESLGFELNEEKSRLQSYPFRQEVTGLVVNEKVNVKRKFIKDLRMLLYYWERYGANKLQEIYIKEYHKDNSNLFIKSLNVIEVLKGKLNYLKMVKGADDSIYLSLSKRLQKLQRGVVTSKINTVSEKESNHKEIPWKHHANKLPRLLEHFSNGNFSLKYVTHIWEPNRFSDYESFLKQVKYDWDKIKVDLSVVNSKIHAKISNFIFNPNLGERDSKGQLNAWGMNLLKFGWSSPALIEYCKNTQQSPFDAIVPLEIRTKETIKNLYYFGDYVNVFKNEIEIREEGRKLSKIIQNLWKSSLGYDFNIVIENLDGISFYSDVQWLTHALKLIFLQFRQRPEYPQIKVYGIRKEQSEYFELRLEQFGSECTRRIEDKKIRTLNSGDFLSIANSLNGVCDWSIVAKFVDGKFYKINYLSSLNSTIAIEQSSSVNGFTHVLRIYL